MILFLYYRTVNVMSIITTKEKEAKKMNIHLFGVNVHYFRVNIHFFHLMRVNIHFIMEYISEKMERRFYGV